jgi:hypothetical protein
MTIILGVIIIALVVFMVLAMAVAEWADKDPGEIWAAWSARLRGTPSAAPAPQVSADTAGGVRPAARKKGQAAPGKAGAIRRRQRKS